LSAVFVGRGAVAQDETVGSSPPAEAAALVAMGDVGEGEAA
jgi:hypothetical protein